MKSLPARLCRVQPARTERRDRPDAVPFPLEPPAAVVRDCLQGSRRSPASGRDRWRGGVGVGALRVRGVRHRRIRPTLVVAESRPGRPRRLVLHPVHQPRVVLGADQHVPAAGRSARCRTIDHLVVAPLLGDVGAGVPDGHGAAAVLAPRDDAGEIGVVQRVVLGLHGQPVLPGVRRNVLGHRPGHQHAAALEPEVVVQPAGVMFLDDEGVVVAVRQDRAPGPVPGSGRRTAWRGTCPACCPVRVPVGRIRSAADAGPAPSRWPDRPTAVLGAVVVAGLQALHGIRRLGEQRQHLGVLQVTQVRDPPAPPRCAAPRRWADPGRAASTARWWSSNRCSATSR